MKQVAEDLGVITPDVEQLRDEVGLPGMKVLQFEVADAEFDISTVPVNCVCYTGTHDNDTTLGWFMGSPGDIRSKKEIAETQKNALAVTGGTPETICQDMIRLAFATDAQVAIGNTQKLLPAFTTVPLGTNVPDVGFVRVIACQFDALEAVEGLQLLDGVALDRGQQPLPHDLVEVHEDVAPKQPVDLILARVVAAHELLEVAGLVRRVVVDVELRVRCQAVHDHVDAALEGCLLTGRRHLARGVLAPEGVEQRLTVRVDRGRRLTAARESHGDEDDEDAHDIDLPEAVVNALDEITSQSAGGDVLVFLPGVGEIRGAADELRGGDFDLQEYYQQPELYEGRFEDYLPHLDVLLNTIYWEPRYPRLVTKQWVKENRDPRLQVIGDISCDIDGSIDR